MPKNVNDVASSPCPRRLSLTGCSSDIPHLLSMPILTLGGIAAKCGIRPILSSRTLPNFLQLAIMQELFIEDFQCALEVKIIRVFGRMFVAEHHVCFYATAVGFITKVCPPALTLIFFGLPLYFFLRHCTLVTLIT